MKRWWKDFYDAYGGALNFAIFCVIIAVIIKGCDLMERL